MGELGGLLAMQGVGAAASVGSAASNAQAARGQQQYANAMTDVNSEWSRMHQAQILAQGDVAGSRARQGYLQTASTQKAAQAGSGVDVNSGSALAVRAETRALGDVERLDIQRQAYNHALGLRAENLSAQGQNRMRQIAMRQGINQSYAGAAMNVAQASIRSGYYASKYAGLDQKPQNASAIDQTLNYVPPDLMAPNRPYDQNLDPQTGNA